MTHRRFYAGIGSRETPKDVLALMKSAAATLAGRNYVLRTGGAPGADEAFFQGATGPMTDLFLPWRGFNGHANGRLNAPSSAAMKLAAELHPRWDMLSVFSKKLVARNCHQVLGEQLDDPSHFILCWTPDGAVNEDQCGIKTGGTGTAIRLASRRGIRVFNLHNSGTRSRVLLNLCKAP